MTEPPDPHAAVPADQEPVNAQPPDRVLKADQLFAGQREITIEHAGERYRLRITRRNKLILQK